MKKLFGTDGIRGDANKYPFNDDDLVKIGKSLINAVPNVSNILIARDTRESGGRIVNALAKGLSNDSIKIYDAGVVPTPVLSYALNKTAKFDIGIMVSASHNPFQDNGIKVFNGEGNKISDEHEKEIENLFFSTKTEGISNETPDLIDCHEQTVKFYIDAITEHFKTEDKPIIKKAVVDCSNGAAYKIAEEILSKYVQEAIFINNEPDGKNINYNCGSTHMDILKEEVAKHKADIGIAFDGDGDRALFVDDKQRLIDGDYILALAAINMKTTGELTDAGVISTVMANFGLEDCLKRFAIPLHRTNVGDKYVWEKMIELDSVIGGEQSGHIIFRNFNVTGDGILTALKLLEIINTENKPLSVLAECLDKYPQILENVKVSKKIPLDKLPKFMAESEVVVAKLSGKGRLVTRYSGTENLLRIMIEGNDQEEIKNYAKSLAKIALDEINMEVSI